jgi:4-carboxymuconolactone decarboxylase
VSSDPPHVRIRPLGPSDRSDVAQDLLRDTAGRGMASHHLETMVRAEGLTRRWLPFACQVANGSIPARDRELAILRTAWNCKSSYEWAEHVRAGRAAGLSIVEISEIPSGPSAGWGAWDGVILRAVDELLGTRCITDGTWADLAEHYDDIQLIEFSMLVGHYQMVAMTLNTLGVELDDGLSGLPQ